MVCERVAKHHIANIQRNVVFSFQNDVKPNPLAQSASVLAVGTVLEDLRVDPEEVKIRLRLIGGRH